MERILRGAWTLALVFACAAAARTARAEEPKADAPKMVGQATCAGCHAEKAEAFAKTFHGRKAQSSGKLANTCESCHGAGSAHVDGGGDVSKIVNPKKLDAAGVAELCMSCHKDKALIMWKTGPHAQNGVSCLTCHSVHDGAGRKSLVAGGTETCYKCHKKQQADMRLPSHHPLADGKMSCVSCHNPHGGIDGNLKEDSLEATCGKCHMDKIGPFSNEHPPVADGCQNCHLQHGSANERMLKMPIQFLCISCHKKVHNSLATNTVAATWRQRERCVDCHREIHGSNRTDRFIH